jgi:AraC-like DNA-binding protein
MSERLFLRLDEDHTQGPESEAPTGTLRALPFDASLRAQVAHVLAYREAIAPGREVVERVLPDGAVRLVFNLGTGAPNGLDAAAASALVIGAQVAPTLVRLRGAMDGLSVTLRPGATQALFGLPAGAIEGTTVPLEDLWRGGAAQLLEQLSSAADDAARLRALQTALRGRLHAHGSTSAELVTQAAVLLRGANGPRTVRDVAAALGISERRLQQLFHAQVGLSPRTFSRLQRLHGMLRVLRRHPMQAAWADIAAAGGFYDQAHLANEFRALCGMTPSEFMRRTISASSKTAA